MNNTNPFDEYHTTLVQNIGSRTGAIAPTMTPSAAFGYADAEEAEGIFSAEIQKPLYARMGNPTNAKLEEVVAQLEGGIGAIATASGMGAISMVCTALLSEGDELLCVGGFFGGTYSLDDFSMIESTLQRGIKMVMFESVGNPSLTLPDVQRIIDLCTQYDTVVMVDNTVTPLLLRPLAMGADIVVHSSTKTMSGHSAALGGIAVFREVQEDGKLWHPKYKDLHPIMKKMGKKAWIPICKKRAMRDYGMTANAFGSFMTLIGLETLALRVERVNRSVARVASILNEQLPESICINHPSLSTSPDHTRYCADFAHGCGPILTLDCGNQERAFALLNRLKLAILTANIGDNRTLALHMTSTIYRDFDEGIRRFLGVSDGLIRVSIGLETPEHIAEDFLQACRIL